jgi:type II secretory pathway pseudopilin PulG
MGLRGQGSRVFSERGYAMAALLVALAVMAILMSVAMPVWRQQARREKEAELVWRGEQYARAIALYRFKMGQQGQSGMILPPSIDLLVEQRFLRKKYKDPMTKDGEFVVMPAGGATPGVPGPGRQGPGPTQQPPGLTPGGQRGAANAPQPGVPGQLAIGGVMGVRSKSEETSLRSYRGQTRYDQWQFTFNTVPRPGGMAPAANTPDGRGGPNNPNVPGGPRGNAPFGSPGTPPFGGPGIGNPGGRGNQPRGGGPGGPGGIDPRSGPTVPGRSGRGPGLQ